MAVKVPPCKGCEERHEGCHAECDRFIKWKADRNAMNEERYKQKEKEGVTISDRSIRKHWQNKRYRNQKYHK